MAKLRAGLIFIALFLPIFAISAGPQTKSETQLIFEVSQPCLLGGVKNGYWVESDKLGPILKGTKNAQLYTLTSAVGAVSVRNIKKFSDEPCPDFWEVDLEQKSKNGIAITLPSWKVVPRSPRAINPHDATYVRIVGDILRQKGITRPEVKITDAYKIDLDGDGTEEVVIAANRTSTSPGNYSLILLRKVFGGAAKNIFLSEIYYPKEASTSQIENHITAIADLNGDGNLEIVVHHSYYEGSGSYVIELEGAKPKVVLECFCGA